VIGASLDPEELNAEFREKEELEYDLVSDTTHELGNELGLVEEMGDNKVLRAARTTYLLEPDGTILKIWQVGRGELIDAHPDEVLAFVHGLRAA
jgi:peroxiredoxin Q/BCP